MRDRTRPAEDRLRITGSCVLPFEREKTYQNLHNPDILARCLPGCDKLEKARDNEYAVRMKLALGAVSSMFTGKIEIAEANPPQSFKMLVEGRGNVGFLRGEGLMNLIPSLTGTELTYDGDVQVGGAIVAVGQRTIDTTAKMMIRTFFEKFVEEVNNQP